MKDDGLTATRHGRSPIGCADEVLMELVIAETMDTYKTPAERAAYRAGMSSSAAICDAVAAQHAVKRMNKTQIMLRNNARTCGDEIMRLRELVKVNEPRGLSAGEDASSEAVNPNPPER